MTIMAIIAILFVVALIVTFVKVAQHKYAVAFGTFGFALTVAGVYFYTEDWRARAYEVIGDPLPLKLVAEADVYNGIAVMGLLMMMLSGIVVALKVNRQRSVQRRAANAPKEPSRSELSSDTDVQEMFGTGSLGVR